MFETSLVNNFKNRDRKAFEKITFEENQIVEEYEGTCEECERETKEKVCPICAS